MLIGHLWPIRCLYNDLEEGKKFYYGHIYYAMSPQKGQYVNQLSNNGHDRILTTSQN